MKRKRSRRRRRVGGGGRGEGDGGGVDGGGGSRIRRRRIHLRTYFDSVVIEVEPGHGVLQEGDDSALEVESARVLVRSGAHLLHDAILVRKPKGDKIRKSQGTHAPLCTSFIF